MAIWDLFRPVDTPSSLWDSQAKAVVLAGLQRAKTAEWLSWREQWKSLHRFLLGQHLVDVQVAAHVSHPERSREWDKNSGAGYRYVSIVQAYADRLAVCFHTPPRFGLSRNGVPLPDTDPQVRQLHRDLEDGEWDTTLPHVESLVTTLEQCFVVPAWVAGKIKLYAYAPYEVYVQQSPLDPADLSLATSVSVEIRQPADTLGARPSALDTSGVQPAAYQTWVRREDPVKGGVRWEYWVHDERGARLPNPLFQNREPENPYGMHPIVLWQTRKPAGGRIFVPPKEAWLQQQLGVDIAVTDIHYGLRYAAHPQWVRQGVPLEESPTFGPDRLVSFPDATGDLKAVTPPLNVEAVTRAVEWDLRIGAVSESMPPDTYAPTAARSAAGIQVQRHDLQLRRNRVVPFYRRALRRTFDALRAVGNYWAGQGADRIAYLPDVELTVEFAELPQIQDRFQDIQSTVQELNAGLTSEAELEMQAHPEIDRAEAMRRVQRRQADRAATNYQPQAPAAATPGEGEPRGVLARDGSGP